MQTILEYIRDKQNLVHQDYEKLMEKELERHVIFMDSTLQHYESIIKVGKLYYKIEWQLLFDGAKKEFLTYPLQVRQKVEIIKKISYVEI